MNKPTSDPGPYPKKIRPEDTVEYWKDLNHKKLALIRHQRKELRLLIEQKAALVQRMKAAGLITDHSDPSA